MNRTIKASDRQVTDITNEELLKVDELIRMTLDEIDALAYAGAEPDQDKDDLKATTQK